MLAELSSLFLQAYLNRGRIDMYWHSFTHLINMTRIREW